jgi:hypothetical protein
MDAAHKRTEEIVGYAYAAMNKAKELTETAHAMKNIIEGYGDQYIIPTFIFRKSPTIYSPPIILPLVSAATKALK